MNKTRSTTEQLNNLIEFRQAIYAECLTGYRDTQFELMESLLSNPRVNSYAELSLLPVFQRQWPSVYTAIRAGRQDRAAVARLLHHQLPRGGIRVLAVDTTVWPHPSARTLAGQVYEHSPTLSKGRHVAVKGHVFSSLCWLPVRGGSWALPLDTHRLDPAETAVELARRQIETYRRQRSLLTAGELDIVTGDGKYGNHHFLQSFVDQPGLAAVVRLRGDRVLYFSPGPYPGRGRPRKHGRRFVFKNPATWPTPTASVTFTDDRWGEVRLRAWSRLHARQDSATVMLVIRAEVQRQRTRRPLAVWLAYVGPAQVDIATIWRAFDQRWSIEPHFRFRKQRLNWTLPLFQQVQRTDRWTTLVDLSYWQLYLARTGILDQPLPWQKAMAVPTPGRVLQGFAWLFGRLPTQTCPVQTRGKPPGWPKGRRRKRPKRHKTVRRGRKAAAK